MFGAISVTVGNSVLIPSPNLFNDFLNKYTIAPQTGSFELSFFTIESKDIPD